MTDPGSPSSSSSARPLARHRTRHRAAPARTAPAPTRPATKTAKPAVTRVNNPDHTVQDIIAIATEEFARKGLAGARVDEIAARMKTSKRTIYYYFGSKEKLYLAVLEAAYRRVRAIDTNLELDQLDAASALTEIAGRTFDFQGANEDFVRLIMNENIHNAVFLRELKDIQRLNASAIDAVCKVYERGCKAGVFRKGVEPIDIHMTISALSFFNVSNRHTFSLIFKHDMTSPKAHAARRANVIEAVMRYVKK